MQESTISDLEATKKAKRKSYSDKYVKNNREKINLKQKLSARKNKVKYTNYIRIKLFNITTDEYNILLAAQESKCAICGIDASTFSRSLCIDHDHLTGKVRGLLCNKCNRGIGLLQDNINILTTAYNYLLQYEES